MGEEAPKRTLGPGDGTIEVHTQRDGLAAAIGHDLILELGRWQARIETGEDGLPTEVQLDAEPDSLRVREAKAGAMPLSDGDRSEIDEKTDEKVLRGKPIRFSSSAVEADDDNGLTVAGELEIAGESRSVRFELERSAGRITGTLPLVQSEWGIKPYSGLLGTLKVKDAIEVALDVELAATGAE